MKRFIVGARRSQSTLFPEYLEDWVGEDNPVRVIDVFVEELDLGALGFERVDPKGTGRPGYHPSVLLKLYIYGYLNRVQSSRRLEREAGRNVEVRLTSQPALLRQQALTLAVTSSHVVCGHLLAIDCRHDSGMNGNLAIAWPRR